MVSNVLVRANRDETAIGGRGSHDGHARVLVVSTYPLRRHSLAALLTEEGYWITVARGSSEAIDELSRTTIDALVVETSDTGPDDELSTLREQTDLPIIALVEPGKSPAADAAVAAFDAGADDCAVWSDPAAGDATFPELTRRLAALLRRAEHRHSEGRQVLAGPATLVLRPRAHEASVAGKDLDLTPKEFGVLQLLLERRRDVLTADAISEALWGHETFGARNFVEAHVSRLRHNSATPAPAMSSRQCGASVTRSVNFLCEVPSSFTTVARRRMLAPLARRIDGD